MTAGVLEFLCGLRVSGKEIWPISGFGGDFREDVGNGELELLEWVGWVISGLGHVHFHISVQNLELNFVTLGSIVTETNPPLPGSFLLWFVFVRRCCDRNCGSQ